MRVCCLALLCLFSFLAESYAQNNNCFKLEHDIGITLDMQPEETVRRIYGHIQGMLSMAQKGKPIERVHMPKDLSQPRLPTTPLPTTPGLELEAEFELAVTCTNITVAMARATGKSMQLLLFTNENTRHDLLNWALANRHDPQYVIDFLKTVGIELPDKKEHLETMAMTAIMNNRPRALRLLVEKHDIDPLTMPVAGHKPPKDASGLPAIMFQTISVGAGEVLAYLFELYEGKQPATFPQATTLAMPEGYLKRGIDYLLDSSPLDLPERENYETFKAKMDNRSEIAALGKFHWKFHAGVSVLGERFRGTPFQGTELAGPPITAQRNRGRQCRAEFQLRSANTKFLQPSIAQINMNYSFSLQGGERKRTGRSREKDRADLSVEVGGEHVLPICNTNDENSSLRQWVYIASTWNVYDNDNRAVYVVQGDKTYDLKQPVRLDRSKGEIRVGVAIKHTDTVNGPAESANGAPYLNLTIQYYNDFNEIRQQKLFDYFKVAALALVMRLAPDTPEDLQIYNLRNNNPAVATLFNPYLGGETFLAQSMPRTPPAFVAFRTDQDGKPLPADMQKMHDYWFATRFVGEYPILFFITRALEDPLTTGLNPANVHYLTAYRRLLSLWCKKHYYPRIHARAVALAETISNEELARLNRGVLDVLKADKISLPQVIRKLESLIAHGGFDEKTTADLRQELHRLKSLTGSASVDLKAFRTNYRDHLQRVAQEYNDLVRELAFYVTDEELKPFKEIKSWIKNG